MISVNIDMRPGKCKVVSHSAELWEPGLGSQPQGSADNGLTILLLQAPGMTAVNPHTWLRGISLVVECHSPVPIAVDVVWPL